MSGTTMAWLRRDGSHLGRPEGPEGPTGRPPAAVGVNTTPSLMNVQAPRSPAGGPDGPGLLLGHNMAVTPMRTELPASTANWPELAGEVIGFRPAEACDIAASWFPRVDTFDRFEGPELTSGLRLLDDGTGRALDTETGELVKLRPGVSGSMRLLNDGTGRAVDTETGELVKLITGDEVRAGRAKLLRRLVIAGGKVAIECGQISHAEQALTRVEAEIAAAVEAEQLQLEFDRLLDAIDGLGDAEILDDDGDGGEAWNVVRAFSRKARQRLRQKVAEVDWCTPLQREGVRIGMLTLTYPGEWEALAPDPDTVTAHRHALERRLERALGYPPPFFWVREFQLRGAPHFHLGGVFPTRINGESLEHWLSRNWYEIVGSGDERHRKAGTGVDWAEGLRSSDPNRLAAYFSAYSTGKGGKEYQHHPPEGWCNENGSAGRHWGYRGVTFVRAEVRVSRDQMIEVQRFLRHYIASHKRTMRTKGAHGQRSRAVNRRWQLRSLVGLESGFTLLTNDGPGLAIAIARAITEGETGWPPGQRRPLP